MLALKGTGLRILVVDKAGFPRHKPCGDAIPFQALKELEKIWRGATEAIRSLPSAQVMMGCRLFAPSGRECYLPFVNAGMTATRYEFDELLFCTGLEACGAEYRQAEARQVNRNAKCVTVILKDGTEATARLLIAADGANSVAARSVPETKGPLLYPAAARYHLQGRLPDRNALYIWFPPSLQNGYFWAFPLGGGQVNAGIGAFPAAKDNKKPNLRQQFNQLLESGLPGGMALTAPAAQDAWLGQAVPCAEAPFRLCDDRILLVGDAAGLVQAATGEGIGHAVVSGVLAAKVALEALRTGNLTQSNLHRLYAKPLLKRIGSTLQRQHRIVRWAMRMPWLVEGVIFLGSKSSWVARRVRSI